MTPALRSNELIQSILQRYDRQQTYLLPVLVDLQQALHCIPSEAIDAVATHLGLTHAHVRGMIGFFSFLSETHLGEYVVYFSDNVTDRMLGSGPLAEYLCSRLGVKLGRVRGDGRVSVHFTSCTGMCDQGPAALVNGLPITHLTRERIDAIADLITSRTPVPEWPQEFFRVEDNIRRSDVLFRTPLQPGEAIQAAIDRGAEESLKELYRSDLRGRGGAGFKAAMKWETCRDAPSDVRYVICNADEGEPGTFKDRVLLTSYTDMVFEGMTTCGYMIGSSQGILYIRYEYTYLKPHLEAVLQRRREAGLLGRNIRGTDFSFDIEIRWGAGAYICGMESALIESVEGRRGKPRKRWPLPVLAGYNKKPTVVNNVETFAAAAAVVLRGGAWFAAHGTMHSAGTKLFCVSGDCERPGIYEYPFGVSVREILRDCGASEAMAVQISGPSGTTITRLELDRTLAFEDLSTVGTFMVFNRIRDMFEIARNFTHFFQHESCGLCTPCRVGTSLLVNLVEKVAANKGTQNDLDDIQKISHIMKTMSHCGLGQTASNHLMDSLMKFPQVWESRMSSSPFEPAFDLDASLETTRQLAGRLDAAAHL